MDNVLHRILHRILNRMFRQHLKYISSLPGALPIKGGSRFNEVNADENKKILKLLFSKEYADYIIRADKSGCVEYIEYLAELGEIEFGDEDMIYNPLSLPKIRYSPQSCYYKHFGQNRRISQLNSLSHNGRAKLLIADIQALAELIEAKDKPISALYIGAAPGNQTVLLAKIFTNVKFILYDKAPFNPNLKKIPNIEIINEFFTEAEAEKYSGKIDIVISDMRLEIDKDKVAAELQIHEDMTNQQKWVKILAPKLGAMLKFRPPYMLEVMPKEIPAPSEYRYLAGKIFWQVFPHIQSTEGRLLLTAEQIAAEPEPFDYVKYESAALQHNLRRVWCTYKVTDPKYSAIGGFDRCLDCTYMLNEISRFGLMDHLAQILVEIRGLVGCCDTSPTLCEPRILLHGYFQNETRFQKHIRFIELYNAFLYKYRDG